MKYVAYPNYKFSGTEWIGDIPSKWECRRLKDCGTLFAGAGFPHEFQWLEDEELPFYKVGDLSQSLDGRHMVTGEHTISRETAYALRAKVIPPSAVVYAKIGAALLLNRRRITVNDCCIDNNMTAFIPNQRMLSTAWAHYWLCTLDFGEFTNPGAVPSFSEGYQAILPITLPSLDEQQTIARFLDAKTAQIDALVAQKRQLIAKLKEKRSALITRTVTRGLPPQAAKAVGLEPHPEMKDSGVEWIGQIPEGWCVVPFKRRAGFLEGPGIMAADFMDEGVPLIRISGLAGKYASLEGANYLDPDLVSLRWAHFKTNLGDLLISGSASTGLCCEVESSTVGCIPYTGIIIIRAIQERSCNDFLRWYFQSDQFLAQVFLLKTGSTIQHFGPSHLAKMTIALPGGLNEQRAIAEFLDRATVEIDSMAEAVEAAIERLVEYRQAVITSAVTGKIDVRDPVPNKPTGALSHAPAALS